MNSNLKKLFGLLALTLITVLIIAAKNPPLKIYMIGDSTMAIYDTTNNNPQRGWGQMLPQFFTAEATIINSARGGRSSKSFYNEGLWAAVINQVNSGDYVFIQFAHNDEKTDTAYHTDPWTTYQEYLAKYINETRAKGGIPVLFTPIVRRYFDGTGQITELGKHNVGPGSVTGNYPMAMKALADSLNVPYIDLTEKTETLVETYGPDLSTQLYIPTDQTHPNILGATLIAHLAAEGIKEKNIIPLMNYINSSSDVVVSPTSVSFGDVYVGNVSSVNNFTVSAFNLSPETGTMIVSAPTGFQVSTSASSGFASTCSLAYSGGTLATANVYIRFQPSIVKEYNDTVFLSVSGSNMKSLPVFGQGIAVPTGLVPARAVWTLLSNQQAAISGSVSADDETISNLPGIQYNTSFPNFGSGWHRIATTAPNLPAAYDATKYVDYKITPQPGHYFITDTIKLSALGGGTGNCKLAIYYSLDGTNFLPIGPVTLGTSPATTSPATIASPVSLLNSGGTNTGAQNISVAKNITVKGGTTFTLRLYPWSTTALKYLAVKDVYIIGNTKTASPPTPPQTAAVTNIFATTATSGGSGITSDSNSVITAKGVCWNTSGTPTTGDPKTNNGSGVDDYISNLTGLAPGYTYYVRAYATNAAGTSYGNEVSFTTSATATLPIVITSAVSSITTNSAVGGGEIASDGGGALTASGLCWNTTGNPTTDDFVTNVGTATGTFTSTMTSLVSSTVYYVRAYATNSAGTAYGEQVVFTTVGNFYNVAGSDVSLSTSWGSNTDGSGSHPDFMKDNQNYFFINQGNTFSQNWTISPLSKLIIGNGTDSINFIIPAAYYFSGKVDVSANASLTVRNSSNLVMGDLNLNSNVYFDGSNSLTIVAGNYGNVYSTNDASAVRALSTGTITVRGIFNSGNASWTAPTAGTVIFNGSTPQILPSITFYNLQINNPAGVSVNGTVILNSGGLLTVTAGTLSVTGTLDNRSVNAPVLSGTLNIKNGGFYKISGGPIPTAVYDAGSTVQVESGSPAFIANIGGNLVWNSSGQPGISLTMNSIGGNFTVNNGTFNQGTGGVARTVSVGGNMYINGGTYYVAGYSATNPTTQTLTVGGNLVIAGGTLYASNNNNTGTNGTINVAGNLIHSSGILGNGPYMTSNLTGKIVFNGSANQSISSTGFTNNLSVVINNSAGVSLASDLTIDAVLTMTSGNCTLGSYNLIMNTNATIAGSPSASSMIIASGSGEFRKRFSSPGSFTFPVGEVLGTAEYTPVLLNVSASEYNNAYISVKTIRAKHPANSSTTDYLNRYWTISQSGLVNGVYSGTFSYPAADVNGTETNIYGAHYDGSVWHNVGVINSVLHSFSTPSFFTLGDFTGADGSVVPASPVISLSATGLAFGRVNRNTTSPEKTYSITAHSLIPADGNIIITVPSPFSVSLVSGSGFDTSLSIPYTAGSLNSTTIYVRFSPPAAQNYSGIIVNSGGGAIPQNVNLTGTGIIPNSELGVNMIIAQDGTGDYTTWQAAINAIPVSHPEISPYIIYVRPGFYHEKVTIPATLSDIKFVGEDMETTILDYDDYVGSSGTPGVPGTNAVQTLQINSSSTTFQNLTIQNLVTVERAVAINIGNAADKVSFYNCNILGHQDTYYFYNCYRVYHKLCKISGSVDFIFGNGTAVFDSCIISVNRNGGVITAPSTGANLLYGLVFRGCTIVPDSIGFDGIPISGFYLGRPWNNNPKSTFLYCYEPAKLTPAGWTLMNSDPSASVNQNTLFAEFQCWGPGFLPSSRSTIAGNPNYGRQLSEVEAQNYSLTNIFAAASKTDGNFPNGNWLPDGANDILPVQLSSFTAASSGSVVILRWRTETEIHNYGWDIQRRKRENGNLSSWEKIAFVMGSSNSGSPKDYSYTDKSVFYGEYEYRLKQIDLDGAFNFSDIVKISVGNRPIEFSIKNYPNPFNPSTVIRYEIPKLSKVTISVFNLLGERVATLLDEYVKEGIYQISFDASHLPTGIYFYNLTSEGVSLTRKMLFMK